MLLGTRENAGSEETHFEAARVMVAFNGAARSHCLRSPDRQLGNNINQESTPGGTVPEHLFEKKQLVLALQQLIASYSET